MTARDSRTGHRLTTPHHIGDLLAGAQREAARAAGVGPLDRETWRRVVGDRIANRTLVTRLEGGVLEVRVASSVWAQELSMLSGEIIARLKARRIHVHRIRFRAGKVPDLEVATLLEPAPPPVPLPPDLAARLAEVDDPDLAAVIAQAASHSLARAARLPEAAPSPRAPRSNRRR